MDADAQLLARWAEGDERAGKTLVERHYSAVFRFFRAKAVADLDDLVQETFLGLVKGQQGFRAASSFRAYLFGTARNLLHRYYRRRGRKEGRIDLGTQSVLDLGPSPSAILVKEAEKRLLLEGLRRIAVDDQIVIELYHWEELTGPEIAAVLGVTEPALRSRLHRAKQRLAAVMKELAASPTVLQSTLDDFEEWARRIRDEVGTAPSHRG